MRKKTLLVLCCFCFLILIFHIFFAHQGLRNSIQLQKKFNNIVQKQIHINEKIQLKQTLINLMKNEDKDVIEERIIKILKYTTPKHIIFLVNNNMGERKKIIDILD